ncbi:MAG: asparagine synthase (glutamine-hydrolyzing) [Anaerolineae bacterium]|nr:asparagine synthase (glutamine-hydrolyzing) [Anaerolineae bacterium]
MLAAYRQWGQKCVSRFNGMWAFALWDNEQRQLFCSRDHFGIKPFYYHRTTTRFVFASEIKAIQTYTPREMQPNWSVLSDFLVYGLVDHSRHTFFRDVDELPPAHSMIMTADSTQAHQYWHLDPVPTSGRGATADEVATLGALLADSVRIRLRSDVPVGTCLSGGMDSTTIAVLMDEIRQDAAGTALTPQRSYTACYDDARYDERRYVKTLVGTRAVKPTYTYPDGAGLLADLESLVWHQEMPFQSTSMYAQYCVMRAARQDGTTVLLDGQGADEILAGYPSYLGAYSASLLRAGQWARWAKEVRAYPVQPPATLPATFRAALTYLLPQRIAQAWLRRARPLPAFVAPDLSRLASAYRAGEDASLDDPLATTLYRAVMRQGLQCLLRYEDRNSMAFSIEARLPFLDQRVVEFALRLPAGAKIEGGWTKAILRKAMAGRLPDEIRLRREKMGFPTPEAAWLQQGSRQWRREIMTQERIRQQGVLNWPEVDRWLAALEENVPGGGESELWRCISVTLWLDRFFASNGIRGNMGSNDSGT